MLKIGILALQGDVAEHRTALAAAAAELGMGISITLARDASGLAGLDGIVLPGGESTTIWKLLSRHGMAKGLKKIPCVFGTCAGLILMARHAEGRIDGQQTLGLLDIEVARNAYGPQTDSFEAEIKISGENGGEKIMAAFIRAPAITSVGTAKPVAWHSKEVVGVESESAGAFYLGMACHPEIAGETYFHKLFIEKCMEKKKNRQGKNLNE
ncbi:MAG: pyridoxal 5'-phosphate synthase glutaminase subunit PdxT [Candidatus Micrarchaeia archaeon]